MGFLSDLLCGIHSWAAAVERVGRATSYVSITFPEAGATGPAKYCRDTGEYVGSSRSAAAGETDSQSAKFFCQSNSVTDF